MSERSDYPWYGVVRGRELEQGDLLVGCPRFVIPPDATRVDTGLVVTRERVGLPADIAPFVRKK